MEPEGLLLWSQDPPRVPILSQINSILTLHTCFLNICFNIILSTPRTSSGLALRLDNQNFVRIYNFSHRQANHKYICKHRIRGGRAPRILKLGSRWRWMLVVRLRTLYYWVRILGAHCIGRGGLVVVTNRKVKLLLGIEPRRPVCRQTLYWLRDHTYIMKNPARNLAVAVVCKNNKFFR
jgi:hypothetical protein